MPHYVFVIKEYTAAFVAFKMSMSADHLQLVYFYLKWATQGQLAN